MCNDLERAFKKHFKMKILGSIKHIFGMDVYNNLDEHKVFISQRQYIADSVKRYSKYNLYANGTRPDIAFAVTTLAKYTSNPGEIHWQALLRV